jgi:hypothetical protein
MKLEPKEMRLRGVARLIWNRTETTEVLRTQRILKKDSALSSSSLTHPNPSAPPPPKLHKKRIDGCID